MGGRVDEMAELREHAAAQAALFNFGVEENKLRRSSRPMSAWMSDGRDCKLPELSASESNVGTGI